ncbi:hypothetical protein [Sporichthya sp.]|uniref:hypothetical protein n=1 Tax=Sporichthya sp. TaxID=65475 RepID=UPI0017DFB557|nr:hypothetical protein [Sporichthya sp.]MBA3745342.1 hypothetical protein [Sporichthya sp.]
MSYQQAVRIPVQAGQRVAAACGVLSAVALFLAVAAVDVPRHASEQEMLAWWRDGDNRTADVVSTFALLAAGLLFLGFVTALARQVALRTEGTATLIRQAGTLFVAMIFATGLGGAIVRGLVVDDEPVPGVDVLRFFAQLRYTAMGVYAMPAAAVVIGACSYAALYAGALPRWFGWLGVASVVAIIAATAAFLGQFAIPAVLVWTIAGSVVLLRAPTAGPSYLPPTVPQSVPVS